VLLMEQAGFCGVRHRLWPRTCVVARLPSMFNRKLRQMECGPAGGAPEEGLKECQTGHAPRMCK
jgi:hypothetical protein